MLGSCKVRQKKRKKKITAGHVSVNKDTVELVSRSGPKQHLSQLSVNSLAIIQGVSNLLFTCLHLTT